MQTIYNIIYSDEDCKEKLKNFDFPRVEVGKEHIIEFYIKNESKKWSMEIYPVFEIQTDTESVEFLDLPDKLDKEEKRKVQLRWKPSLEIDDELKGWVGIKGRLLIG